jgi:LysM repeat protein
MVDPIRYIRKLTVLLIFSGSLNIILAMLMFYLFVRERPPTPYFELKPANAKEQHVPLAADRSDSEVIRYFRRMPLEWLISRLDNTQLVENGYTQRDLALASLVAFHSFDLDRAFSGLPKPEQKRLIAYGQFSDGRAAELMVYPGLSDKHFEAIRRFASTERWPLTNRGLFLALQKEVREDYDPSLLDAFFMTSDFSTLEMLFNRSESIVSKEELLKVILEGNWIQLSTFVDQQRKSQDLSAARRQSFLLEYAKNNSKAAAQLLLKTDGNFTARKLDDNQAIMLLELAEEKSPQAEQFALTLLKSPRSDAVRELAAKRLYEYTGTVMSLSLKYSDAVAQFPSEKKQEQKIETKASKEMKAMTISTSMQNISSKNMPKSIAQQSSPKTLVNQVHLPASKPAQIVQTTQNKEKDFYYTIQEGDNLWKIGRRFGVDIEILRAFNQLESDVLRPGKVLRIPKRLIAG